MKTPSIEKFNDVRDLFAPIAFPPPGSTRLFGNLIEQANRQQLVTAVTVAEALTILRHPKDTQAKKQANIGEVESKTNRPTEPAHAKKLKKYIVDALRAEEPFIIPAIIANYGLEGDASTGNDLHVYAAALSAGNGRMAVAVVMPTDEELRMQITDGAHRLSVLLGLLNDKALDDEQRQRLLRETIPLIIVFETSMRQAHQDFADCSKTKPITKDLAVAYDAREPVNAITTAVIKRGKLNPVIDYTASNINLRATNRNIYSAQAVKLFTNYLWDAKLIDNDSVDYLADFWDVVYGAFDFDTFATDKGALQEARLSRGGDVAIRAAACGIFGRAYAEAIARKIDPKAVVKKMADLDWQLLPAHSDDAAHADKGGFHAARLDAAGKIGQLDVLLAEERGLLNPLFSDLTVISPTRYKLSSTMETLDRAWDRMCAEIFGAAHLGEPARSVLPSVRLSVDGPIPLPSVAA